jgi:hypothetical protein
MRRPYLLPLAAAVALPLFACDLLKKKDDAETAAEAGAVATAAVPTAAPTDTGGAPAATPTGVATLGGGQQPGTVTPVAPKADGGPVVDAGAAATDGGPIPTPTLQLPTFDAGALHGFDAGAFIPPGFDAGGFKPPWQQ